MPEDLIITDEPNSGDGEPIKEAVDAIEEGVFEWPTPGEDILSAYNALHAVIDFEESSDIMLLPKSYQKMILRIKKGSLRIIDHQIKYISDCLFDEKKDDDEE